LLQRLLGKNHPERIADFTNLGLCDHGITLVVTLAQGKAFCIELNPGVTG
jgi:hypothetical protein